MIKAIVRGLASLGRFKGRDRSEAFWPYVIFVVAVLFVGAAASIVLQLARSFERMQRFAAAHPDQAHVDSSASGYSISIEGNHPELMPNFPFMIVGMEVTCAVVVVLSAAAVTRRLHDRGRTGLWGLMPLPFLGYGMFGMRRLFDSFDRGEPDFGQFLLMFANNVLYLGLLGVLLIFLVGPGTKGENRFGPEPEVGA